MDRPEATIRKLLAALPAPGYDLGILGAKGMHRLEALPANRILRMLSNLKYRNANGAHIYIRPTGESCYTLLDDLTPASIYGLRAAGYAPAAVIETSPGSFQAWLRHLRPLSKALGTIAAKTLAEQFGADRSAADWRRFGRAPGFTNRKPQHRNAQGLYPFALLQWHRGQVFDATETFYAKLDFLQKQTDQERTAARHRFVACASPSPASLTLSRFRLLPRYQGRPAAADIAFCIAACARGWSKPEIAAALSNDYLSRDQNDSRRSAYIHRTYSKALRWVS